METQRRCDDSIRGCVLLIPSDIFRLAEQEARRQGPSLETFILRLLEQHVRSTRDS
jgi:hypothetical protein